MSSMNVRGGKKRELIISYRLFPVTLKNNFPQKIMISFNTLRL